MLLPVPKHPHLEPPVTAFDILSALMRVPTVQSGLS